MLPVTPVSAFVARRQALQSRFDHPVLLASGQPPPRQYPANTYPFRAKSHFLYFVGESIPRAAILITPQTTCLFVEPEGPDDALWHGPQPSFDELKIRHGVDQVLGLDQVDRILSETCARDRVATLPTEDQPGCTWLSERVGRSVSPGGASSLVDGSLDAALANALIALRLRHDSAAIVQMRRAAEITARAHIAGMRSARSSTTEAQVFAAMIEVLRRDGLEDAYGPIVSTHGEVLHNERHDRPIAPGDLILADVGGEMPEGWAADITRVWPVSGTFSPTQRAIYDIVLATENKAIEAVRPGVRYRDVHRIAARTMVEGLRAIGIFRGDVDGLLARGAAAVFFPHGIGHLLGLDVHDMEDLGDRAGYAPGRTRSTDFGERFLRLDRDLEPGMAVTIEPGFYQVPAILRDERFVGALGEDLRRDVLERFSDVRGIRIEDDVLVTKEGPEVLTGAVPKNAEDVEALVRG